MGSAGSPVCVAPRGSVIRAPARTLGGRPGHEGAARGWPSRRGMWHCSVCVGRGVVVVEVVLWFR